MEIHVIEISKPKSRNKRNRKVYFDIYINKIYRGIVLLEKFDVDFSLCPNLKHGETVEIRKLLYPYQTKDTIELFKICSHCESLIQKNTDNEKSTYNRTTRFGDNEEYCSVYCCKNKNLHFLDSIIHW